MTKLSYDLHIHSCLSPCADEDMTPATIVGMAKVIGLDVIALTDHNTCKNCPAAAAAADVYGMQVIYGMELTTLEEVHVLCYFPTLADAMAFDAFVYEKLPPIPNRPALFGTQYICSEEDEFCAEEPKLLISATDISFDHVFDLTARYHGIMVPAHISKPTTSLLGNLGFVPPNSRFTCAEVSDLSQWPDLVRAHPYLANCRVLCSSDAHRLEALHEPAYFLEAEDSSAPSILRAISHLS